MHGPARDKIYIQPLGFLRGCVALEAVAQGKAHLLAGGPIAFCMVRIFNRIGQRQDMIPVCELESYSGGLLAHEQTEISQAVENICRTRPVMKNINPDRPSIQGIVNVTPDSFSDGGQYDNVDRAVAHAHRLIGDGADFIDIGGESTRPGAQKVTVREELSRVIPVIEGLSDITVPISIDTRNAEVMRQAMKAGASIINDVSALSHDAAALGYVAGLNCPVILMHARNTPENMQDDPHYDHVVPDVYDYLEQRLEICHNAGIDRERVIIDPGIGFGKTTAHNIALIDNLSLFHGLGVPILLGVSRKRFIGHVTGAEDVSERLAGSLAFGQMGYDQGVQILRVHDVLESRQMRDSLIIR
ncbi:Dihydropteroate synthase [hydrothermal vent metagenome]|uniref:dihydropteroate synthase n=1 Tax=hydrothermal vent metagenome TaxID=652676 RepID=A0A3B0R1P5_9ZZZZ